MQNIGILHVQFKLQLIAVDNEDSAINTDLKNNNYLTWLAFFFIYKIKQCAVDRAVLMLSKDARLNFFVMLWFLCIENKK